MINRSDKYTTPEAVVWRCSVKKTVLKKIDNVHKKTRVLEPLFKLRFRLYALLGLPFLMNLKAAEWKFDQKETPTPGLSPVFLHFF